jgi:hypothetical protein
MEQLQSAAAAMQAAEQPAGFLAVQSASELLLGLASQGAGWTGTLEYGHTAVGRSAVMRRSTNLAVLVGQWCMVQDALTSHRIVAWLTTGTAQASPTSFGQSATSTF